MPLHEMQAVLATNRVNCVECRTAITISRVTQFCFYVGGSLNDTAELYFCGPECYEYHRTRRSYHKHNCVGGFSQLLGQAWNREYDGTRYAAP